MGLFNSLMTQLQPWLRGEAEAQYTCIWNKIWSIIQEYAPPPVRAASITVIELKNRVYDMLLRDGGQYPLDQLDDVKDELVVKIMDFLQDSFAMSPEQNKKYGAQMLELFDLRSDDDDEDSPDSEESEYETDGELYGNSDPNSTHSIDEHGSPSEESSGDRDEDEESDDDETKDKGVGKVEEDGKGKVGEQTSPMTTEKAVEIVKKELQSRRVIKKPVSLVAKRAKLAAEQKAQGTA